MKRSHRVWETRALSKDSREFRDLEVLGAAPLQSKEPFRNDLFSAPAKSDRFGASVSKEIIINPSMIWGKLRKFPAQKISCVFFPLREIQLQTCLAYTGHEEEGFWGLKYARVLRTTRPSTGQNKAHRERPKMGETMIYQNIGCWCFLLGEESCRTKVSQIFRIFVPNFAPNFAPNFPRIFRGLFVFRFVGDGDEKKFTKNPRHFSMQIPRQTRKKYSQNSSGEQAK